MFQISADNYTKEDGSKEELLILKYNLDGKVHKQYQDICQDGTTNLFWYLTTEYTGDLAPTDAGTGKYIKFWFGVYLYEWLWDYGSL